MDAPYFHAATSDERCARLWQTIARAGQRIAILRALTRLLPGAVEIVQEELGLAAEIDLTGEGAHEPRIAPDGDRAILPLSAGDHRLGTLLLSAGRPRTLDPGDLPALQVLADGLAWAVHHAQLHDRSVQILAHTEHRAKLLEAASVVGRDVMSVRDLDELLDRMVNTIRAVYGFYYVSVFLSHPSAPQALVLSGATGQAGSAMLASGYQIETDGRSMVGWAVKHRQARAAADVRQDAIHLAHPLLPLTRSEVVLPLLVGDEVIGALDVQSAQVGAFGEEDVATLQALADQLALLINNARLLRDLEAAHRQLLRTKTFEAIATATGEAIHWVGNRAAPVPACIERTRQDLARFIYAAEIVIDGAPGEVEVRRDTLAQVLRKAAQRLGEEADLAAERQAVVDLAQLPAARAQRALDVDSILEDLQIVEHSARTILDIKEDLIGPARAMHLQPLDVVQLARDMLAKMAVSPDVAAVRVADGVPPVLGDETQIGRVFINLVKNAVEAMEGRPEPQLSVEVAPAEEPDLVAVRFIDTGCGIPEEDLDRIWISFYTTKGERGGTGLGLPACLQIVNQMGGRIFAESTPGVGTTFTVLLPAAPAAGAL